MRVALVTGASTGFGKLVVEDLLDRGWTVVAGIRGGESRARQVFAKSFSSESAARLFAYDLHMDRADSLAQTADFVRKECGRLDVLVNNAGYGVIGPAETVSDENIRKQMEVNFFGLVGLTRALLPLLREFRGRIINISSLAGFCAFPAYSYYNASKFAVEGFSEALYHEVRPYGVKVALVEPGGFKTDFAKVGATYDFNDVARKEYPGLVQGYEAYFKEKLRSAGGNPKRVSRLIVCLASKRFVPFRNVIGLDANSIYWFTRIVPSNLRVWLMSLGFSLFLRKRS